jgi:hypothetical protein
MSGRFFGAMLALAIVASLLALASPIAAIGPSLMIFVLGFDAVLDKLSIISANTTRIK